MPRIESDKSTRRSTHLPESMTTHSTSWDVLAVGANSVDYVYRIPAPPQIHGPRAKMRIGRHLISCGGQATTMLATIAAMGLRASTSA